MSSNGMISFNVRYSFENCNVAECKRLLIGFGMRITSVVGDI